MIRDAVYEQRIATDPAYSAWVAANAGSGKTHVLVERIARLLLSGSPPDRLLCLTFTRAAAAEMSTRLFKRLGTWTLVSDAALSKELTALTGDEPDAALMARARRLFAEALESPGGLRIQTIHAFCERLLKRFPLEGGVVPQFSVLDERATEELIDLAKEAVLRRATTSDAALADSIVALTEHAGEERFDALMRGVAGERNWVEPFLVDASPGSLKRILWRAVDLAPGTDERSILAAAIEAFEPAQLMRVTAALALGGKTDQQRARAFARLARQPDQAAFEQLTAQLLTQDGEPRARLASKAVLGADPAIGALLERYVGIVLSTRARLNALFVAQNSAHLLHVAAAMLKAYSEIKSRRAMLDYDDLIGRAVALFTNPGAGWILYKLDGGIDHILVDEAQDTSPAQWKIITAVAEEFFSGLGADRQNAPVQRTVFAVGDVKQSIMSFQGARPASFVETRTVIGEQARGARAEFELVGLTRSFRSAPRILELVDQVFADPAARDGVMIDEVATEHEAVRLDMAGLVELWPTVKPASVVEPDAWDAPVDRIEAAHPAVKLAQSIAERIREWLASGEAIYDKELKRIRPMTAGDVMILVRRRNLLADEIIRQLKRRAIPVAGADRLKLAEHIAVMDLIALGRFVLMPHDDLTLAAVLKGPLCGLDDDALFALAHGRKGPLWSVLRACKGEARFASAAAFLERVWAQADMLQPYEFYASVLSEHGGWTKMLGRLGFDAADPIEEFLNAALAFEQAHTPSLESFLHAIENTETQIKRDQDRGEGSVRVMTVHASKGLEAPVVILPDTCTTPKHGRHDKDLLQSEQAPLWKVESKRDDPVRAAARAAGAEERMREYRRLLYVALTRARDRLYICGYEGVRGREPGCWYTLVEQAMKTLEADEIVLPPEDTIRRFGEVPAPVLDRGARTPERADALPSWVRTVAAEERELRHVAPSLVQPGRSRGDGTGVGGLERGRAIHRALERIGSAPAAKWGALALEVATEILGDAAQAQSAANEALRVRRDLLLAHLFGPGSYGEVPLHGVVDWRGDRVQVAARLDRVVVGDKDVLIVEFKTDRVVPKADSAIPTGYVTQLALYRLAVARLFPGRAVNCAILWTAEPRLTPIASRRLEESVSALDPSHGAT
ncbi:MAG: double-strand break repair helicase AddA [Alphaproteobacteria bacterium]|nr:double-strand break repair helicase AddA [Alphaproteobacteria bacterium]